MGRQTAETLGKYGFHVVLVDLQPADTVVAKLQADGISASAVSGDLTDDATIDKIVDHVKTTYGRIDALVNNAGISSIQPAEETKRSIFERVLQINLVAPFLLCKAFYPMMHEQKSGSIVNVASIAGLYGIGDRTAYNASKHGLVGLTRTLASEWGGRGIRINAVCPGWVKTEMDVADQAGGYYTDDDITATVPMGRFAKPTDIAEAIAFLADSTRSPFVNGHTLVVDGGWTADASWNALRLAHRD